MPAVPHSARSNSAQPDGACPDAQLAFSRRSLVVSAALGTTAAAVFGTTYRTTAYAATPGSGNNVVVVVSLRGAVDGMGVVVPHGEAAYYRARPVIGVPRASLLAADSMFGLHPSLAPLLKYWTDGTFAVVNATGLPRPNRSHFAAMEEVEEAAPGSATREGWVNRLLGDTASALGGVHLTTASAPTLISGPNPTLAGARLAGITLAGADPDGESPEWRTRRRSSLNQLWSTPSSAPTALHQRLRESVRQATAVNETLEKIPMADSPTGAGYDTSWRGEELGQALADTANLIRADVGTTAVTLDFGTWDYHNNYGTLSSGNMAAQLTSLATNLDAFIVNLGADIARVTIVVMSEFGRRLSENSAHGLDHGWGNVMLCLGAGVRGGRYLGRWPGLGSDTSPLVDDDVAVTTDYRDVLADVVAARFPQLSVSTVFPGHRYSPVGVMTPGR